MVNSDSMWYQVVPDFCPGLMGMDRGAGGPAEEELGVGRDSEASQQRFGRG
jgi:hypothetical protein